MKERMFRHVIFKQIMKMKFAQAYIINTDTLCVYALLLKYIKCYSQNIWVVPEATRKSEVTPFYGIGTQWHVICTQYVLRNNNIIGTLYVLRTNVRKLLLYWYTILLYITINIHYYIVLLYCKNIRIAYQ